MTKKRRDVVYNELDSMCKSNSSIQFSTGFASANDIDKYGIQQAISVSINNGLKNLEITPAEVTIFLDGGLKAPQIYKQKTVIGGDGLLQVISLASVVAKVSRDRKMLQFDQKYPLFNFAQHKGYGTKDHREAIGKYGLSPIHRKSYTQNIITP
jgi:ribonuclease HII